MVMESVDSAPVAKSYIIESDGRKFSVPDADLTRWFMKLKAHTKIKTLLKHLK